ncbi:glycoside hydrolase [Edaphobacter sp. HDX4]|uniref:glycoside hydrolase n=1 Tax=Edaphobacter sp. HDX4 TaxID=2794064 RepID=UPI002FE5D30C
MELCGHASRSSDYERFAELGLKTLRLGMLWERHECDPSWRWSDERLRQLNELRIQPIVGLVHHGSGPRHTNLHDPAFAEKLASYAGEFAERYPWIGSYTPINEPHTTARFSGMYGIWYPHRMSRRVYLRALLNQLKGIVLSMHAIRRVRPDARLIQTEDVGNISGTEELRSTWEFLNLRQWLSYDLLFGRVDCQHPMFAYMRAEGITEAEIYWFQEHACPPSILGINYYVTSDRFLDHRLEMYPENRRSAEGPFVDVEAVRVHPDGIAGVDSLLSEAWERYRIPVAITEVHLGCTVDEQIRWLAESWERTMWARSKGVECVALTVWALLGSFYWNELVTRENGHYEPAVFDVRSGSPEPTELAHVVAQIAAGKRPHHAALTHAGWWRHQSRICLPGAEEIAA